VPANRASLASNYIPTQPQPAHEGRDVLRAQSYREIAMAPLQSNPFPERGPEFFSSRRARVKLGWNFHCAS